MTQSPGSAETNVILMTDVENIGILPESPQDLRYSEPFSVASQEAVTASIGLATYPADACGDAL
jgi:hypothetical protein